LHSAIVNARSEEETGVTVEKILAILSKQKAGHGAREESTKFTKQTHSDFKLPDLRAFFE